MKPKGGTELQYDELQKRLDPSYFKKFQITTSVPEKEPIDPDKISILWMKNSYDQPNIAPWFAEKENHRKYDWYVFNSHWTYEKFRYAFGLPTHKCCVIKNALPNIDWKEKKKFKKGDQIKLIHTSTPWRGLNVLVGAMELIKRDDIVLDVYSSTKIYGNQFELQNDKQFQPLYRKMDSMNNINYKGYEPDRDKLMNAMQDSQIFAYPSIWEETFCISAIEAMAAGNMAIVTNFGALFETCTEYAHYVNYETNVYTLAKKFKAVIEFVADNYHEPVLHERLQDQMKYFRTFYNWDSRVKEWESLMDQLMKQKGYA
jgi:glycosyltransferase involved in cell wall biosynthesis